MNKTLLTMLALLAMTLGVPARADMLVLVHGYLGDGMTWRTTGVSAALLANGWRDGGVLLPNIAAAVDADKIFYTAELPSEAPLLAQSDYLAAALRNARQRHPHRKMTVVGHSAGGVVARAAMVRHADLDVAALITIAAPHLGTDTAELGLAAANSPLGWFAPLLGADTLNRSQALYADLVREAPGTLLFWLNRQAHPDAEYISIVREGEGFVGGIVPPYSQHLEFVPALQGKARSVASPIDHGLQAADGIVLLQLLGA